MKIRKATANDSEPIANLILLAMKDIVYNYIGLKDDRKAFEFMHYWTCKENNLYSYQNCWVAECDHTIIAVANIYNAAHFRDLRKPVLHYIKQQYNRELILEDETQAGEYYLDSLGVDTKEQGKGTGTQMLQFLIDEYVLKNQETLGLLVDKENPKAKQLYLRMGFKAIDTIVLCSKPMEHLQIGPNQ